MTVKTRVLLVQEILGDRDAITHGLQSRDYEIIWSGTVSETIAMLEENPAAADVVIAALHLEHASAFDILRVMKQRPELRHIPFIFCCLRPSQFTKTTADSTNFAAKVMGAEDIIIQEKLDIDSLDGRIRWALSQRVEASQNVFNLHTSA